MKPKKETSEGIGMEVDLTTCIRCGVCEMACPHDAVEVSNAGRRTITVYDTCVDCGICVDPCPVDAIEIKTDELKIQPENGG